MSTKVYLVMKYDIIYTTDSLRPEIVVPEVIHIFSNELDAMSMLDRLEGYKGDDEHIEYDVEEMNLE